MNLNKIVWKLFKNIPRIFYEYFPKSNHTSTHKVGGCGSCYPLHPKSFGTKRFHKRSYTIPRRPLEERGGEWAKAEINASWSKITFILGWKLSTKERRSTLASGWKKQRILRVLSNGATCVLEVNARIAWTYSPTIARARA